MIPQCLGRRARLRHGAEQCRRLLPLLGPLAYVPMPTQFHIHFGEPMTFEGTWDDEDEVIQGMANSVKAQIQSDLDGVLARRESIF